MATLTIEIPDDLAAHLDTMPPDARNHFAVAALLDAVDAERADDLTPVCRADLPQTHIAAIEAGLADSSAGRTISGEKVLAHLRQIVGK